MVINYESIMYLRLYIEKSSGQSSDICLYVLVIHEKDHFQVAVGSMLSESQNANAVHFWLAEWLRMGGTPPSEFVCDMGLAILNAAVCAFTNQRSIVEYNDELLKLCLQKKKADHLGTYIRLDVAHVMKAISGWKSLRSAIPKVKEFYMRSVGLLIVADSIHTVEQLLGSIFIVSLCATEGQNDMGDVTCEIAKKDLKIRIAAAADERDCNRVSDTDTTEAFEEDDRIAEKSFIWRWVHGIHEKSVEAARQDNGDRDNLMVNKQFAEDLMTFCLKLPMWSAIAATLFNAPNNTASSATAESYFGDLKRSLDEIPCAADIFVQKMLDMSEGAIILGASHYDNLQSRSEVNSRQEQSDCADLCHKDPVAELNATENWSKKGVIRKTKQSKYLKSAPQWMIPDIERNTKRLTFPLLRNAVLNSNCIRLDKMRVSFQNTSAFDAVCQILAAGCGYNSSYREASKDSLDCIFEIANLLARKYANQIIFLVTYLHA